MWVPLEITGKTDKASPRPPSSESSEGSGGHPELEDRVTQAAGLPRPPHIRRVAGPLAALHAPGKCVHEAKEQTGGHGEGSAAGLAGTKALGQKQHVHKGQGCEPTSPNGQGFVSHTGRGHTHNVFLLLQTPACMPAQKQVSECKPTAKQQ